MDSRKEARVARKNVERKAEERTRAGLDILNVPLPTPVGKKIIMKKSF